MAHTLRKRAPKGKFRVIGVDTVNPREWLEADKKSLRAATSLADAATKNKHGIQMHVYDSNGKHCHSALGWRADFHESAARINQAGVSSGQAPISTQDLARWQNNT